MNNLAMVTCVYRHMQGEAEDALVCNDADASIVLTATADFGGCEGCGKLESGGRKWKSVRPQGWELAAAMGRPGGGASPEPRRLSTLPLLYKLDNFTLGDHQCTVSK